MSLPDVRLGETYFTFTSFENWVNTASKKFRMHGLYNQYGYVAVDAAGRVCQTGREFMRARDEGTFPIHVRSINPPDEPQQTTEPESAQ